MNKFKLLCCLWVAACVALTACSSTSEESEKSLSKAFGPLQGQVADYQKQLAGASSGERFALQILLTRAQILSGNQKGALESIKVLKSEAETPALKGSVSMMEAMYLQKLGKYSEAESKLNSVNLQSLPQQADIYFHQLKAAICEKKYQQSHDNQDLLKAYQEQKILLSLVKGPDYKATLSQCTNILAHLDPAELSRQLNTSRDQLDKGFYEYSLIRSSQSGALKDSLLADLKVKYPNHPVLELVSVGYTPKSGPQPSQMQPAGSQNVTGLQDGDKVAVLLPLTGRFAGAVGNPARQGILAALTARQAQLNVVFYDTNKINLSNIVSQINGDGTKLIIGPILKPEVNALNQAHTTIPSIVLNQPEVVASGQWYFDLGPDYEGALAAVKMLQDGRRSPVVISGKDKGSVRAVDSFSRTLSSQGLHAQVCTFTDPEMVKESLSSCPIQAADGIYIRASAKDAAALKTLIPADRQVYLTDMSYEGYNNSAQEFALQGAILGDMPWLLTDSALKESFMKALPKANAQAQRIFAAAYDSINLAYSMPLLKESPNDVLHGLSGDISLGSNGLIETSPLWVNLGQKR
ncbi:MAG: penicillin-binding protein activator [Succinivibrio sp.]|nr:penicillin-binding protein activator [Succinivibrio sp.]